MPGPKSFRRKYNKIRWKFKSIYEENSNLHLEEQKLVAVSKRLREQNDQLLETLLDINESERIAKSLRYILDPPTEVEVPELLSNGAASAKPNSQAEQMLEEARQQVESGDLMQRDYDILVAELKNSLTKPDSVRTLSQLEKTVSHTSLALLKDEQIPVDIKDEEFSTYLDAAHEDAYLAMLDATIEAGGQVNGESASQKPILSEATAKNPVSTYNWLREHKPEVFVQEGGGAEKEKPEEKESSRGGASTPAATPGIKRESRAVKRASVAELLDDEGNLVGGYTEATPSSTTTGAKSKRKRDDDAYRPKGGGGSSSSKKRKKSTGKAVTEAD